MVGLSQNEMGVNPCRQQDKYRISCSLTVHLVTQPWWAKSLVMHLNLWDNQHAGFSESSRPVFWSSLKYFFPIFDCHNQKIFDIHGSTSIWKEVFNHFWKSSQRGFYSCFARFGFWGRGWGKWGIGDLASTGVWQTVFWWWRLLVRRDGGGECPETEWGGDRRISCAVLGMPLCVYLYCIFLDIRFEHLVEFF